MAEIKINMNTKLYDRVLTIIQASTGCIMERHNDSVIIYAFENFHNLIMDTLITEADANIISVNVLG